MMVMPMMLLLLAAAATATPPQLPAAAPITANDHNLARMARPADLAAPAPASPGNGQLEAAAVARLLADRAKDLRREGTQQGGNGTGSGTGGSAPQ